MQLYCTYLVLTSNLIPGVESDAVDGRTHRGLRALANGLPRGGVRALAGGLVGGGVHGRAGQLQTKNS